MAFGCIPHFHTILCLLIGQLDGKMLLLFIASATWKIPCFQWSQINFSWHELCPLRWRISQYRRSKFTIFTNKHFEFGLHGRLKSAPSTIIYSMWYIERIVCSLNFAKEFNRLIKSTQCVACLNDLFTPNQFLVQTMYDLDNGQSPILIRRDQEGEGI